MASDLARMMLRLFIIYNLCCLSAEKTPQITLHYVVAHKIQIISHIFLHLTFVMVRSEMKITGLSPKGKA